MTARLRRLLLTAAQATRLSRTAHRRRSGVCVGCGQPVKAHFNERNEKRDCAKVGR